MIPSRYKGFQQSGGTLFSEAGFQAPSGHPDRCLVGISLILLCRAWSKLGVQVVVCNWFGDPFKAWVAGSSPAALTTIHPYLRPFRVQLLIDDPN